VLADLAQPVDFETKGGSLRAVFDRLQSKLKFKLASEPNINRVIKDAKPVVDEFRGVASGTALAIMLRHEGLFMRPEKNRGQSAIYRLELATEAAGGPTLGKITSKDLPAWPVGWESDKAPGALAPSLFEPHDSEISGYSLEEALSAITARMKLPLFIDRAVLKANKIELAKIPAKFAPSRVGYKRVIDRILWPAHLGSQIRVDEAGRPFLWITR
jgi:hypothetical protein